MQKRKNTGNFRRGSVLGVLLACLCMGNPCPGRKNIPGDSTASPAWAENSSAGGETSVTVIHTPSESAAALQNETAAGIPTEIPDEADRNGYTGHLEEDPAYEPSKDPVEIPAEILLEDVPVLSQADIAPTGCELVSSQMVLEYYGVDVSFEDIVKNTPCQDLRYMDGELYGPHPENAFIGSPYTESSYGCYAPVVADMLNILLPSDLEAVETTGTELADLAETYLPQGEPVLVWASIRMMEIYPGSGWYLLDENGEPTEEWFDWKANEHCLVLVGYDEDSYIFNDPYSDCGQIAYDRSLAEDRYASMGKYSIVVRHC